MEVIHLICECGLCRFIAVTWPISYAKANNRKRAFVMLFISWAISFGIGLPILLGANKTPDRLSSNCTFYNMEFIIVSSLCSFYIPAFIMIALYSYILYVLHKRGQQKKKKFGPKLKPGFGLGMKKGVEKGLPKSMAALSGAMKFSGTVAVRVSTKEDRRHSQSLSHCQSQSQIQMEIKKPPKSGSNPLFLSPIREENSRNSITGSNRVGNHVRDIQELSELESLPDLSDPNVCSPQSSSSSAQTSRPSSFVRFVSLCFQKRGNTESTNLHTSNQMKNSCSFSKSGIEPSKAILDNTCISVMNGNGNGNSCTVKGNINTKRMSRNCSQLDGASCETRA